MKPSFSDIFVIPLPTIAPGKTTPDLTEICLLASLLDQANKESLTTAAANYDRVTSHSKLTVVLADDDSDDRELFADVICKINDAIRVKTVENGFQLMKVLNEPSAVLPSVIFLDLNMPGKSGKECLVEIKNNARLMGIPVVIYSTSASMKDIQETHGRGANLYISKPSSLKALISVLTQVFSLQVDQLKQRPPMHQFVLSADLSKEK